MCDIEGCENGRYVSKHGTTKCIDHFRIYCKIKDCQNILLPNSQGHCGEHFFVYKEKKKDYCKVGICTRKHNKISAYCKIHFSELLEGVMSKLNLEEEAEPEPVNDNACEICMENDKNGVLKCGHRACMVCLNSIKIKLCPFCNTAFKEVIRTYN